MTRVTSAHLLALDWGTSSLRAFLMQDARIVDSRQSGHGIQHLPVAWSARLRTGFCRIGRRLGTAVADAAGGGGWHGRQRTGLARGTVCALPGRYPGAGATPGSGAERTGTGDCHCARRPVRRTREAPRCDAWRGNPDRRRLVRKTGRGPRAPAWCCRERTRNGCRSKMARSSALPPT